MTIPLADHYPSHSQVEQVLIPPQRCCLVDEQPIIARVMRTPSLARLYDLSTLSRVIIRTNVGDWYGNMWVQLGIDKSLPVH